MSLKGPQRVKNFSLFVDGKGYAGEVETTTLPKISNITTDYRGGGNMSPKEVDLGLEKLEVKFSIASYNPEIWVALGLVPGADVALTLRGSMEQDGDETPLTFQCFGKWREVEFGELKMGEISKNTFTMTAQFATLIAGNVELYYIDTRNNIERIGGIDRMAVTRANIGL